MELTIEQRLARREARDEVENLMGKYVFYRMGGDVESAAALFASRDDVEIGMPMGVYTGGDAACRCFVTDHHADATEPGGMTIHNISTPVIEVAGDGKTARGIWFSPGIATATLPSGKKKGLWAWLRYKCDFILQDGQWKIWHMYKYPLFTVPTDKSWTDDDPMACMREGIPADAPPPPPHKSSADRAPARRYGYDPTAVPELVPVPPLPYDTWDGDI